MRPGPQGCVKPGHLRKLRRGKEGRAGYTYCDTCSGERRRARYAANPAKNIAAVTKYRREHPDWSHAQVLKQSGLVTKEQYTEMLFEQDCVCAICGTDDPGYPTNFAVDHDHRTGQVRALLCRGCNLAIGYMHDDQFTAYEAHKYLERFSNVQ